MVKYSYCAVLFVGLNHGPDPISFVFPINFSILARIIHELLSRDHEDGRATWKPSRGTAGLVSVPERYVAGADIRGRQEGRPYPRSQQVIHELSGLALKISFLIPDP
jgi:hypothetical protein